VTIEQLTEVRIEKIVSAHETTFSLFGTGAGRALNIKSAAARLDGKVIAAGGLVSFNELVGRARATAASRSRRDPGGRDAARLRRRHLPGVDHPACRRALRRAGNRRAPVPLAPLALRAARLDATVSYPLADLKIRNTMTFR